MSPIRQLGVRVWCVWVHASVHVRAYLRGIACVNVRVCVRVNSCECNERARVACLCAYGRMCLCATACVHVSVCIYASAYMRVHLSVCKRAHARVRACACVTAGEVLYVAVLAVEAVDVAVEAVDNVVAGC